MICELVRLIPGQDALASTRSDITVDGLPIALPANIYNYVRDGW